MPELHDLLERRASRYEPAPDLFDRVLDRHRRRDRNRRIGSAVVGVAVAVVGIGGVLRSFSSGGPSSPAAPVSAEPSVSVEPSPATQPPRPFTERFDSPLHGLSIGYPSGWRTRAATEPWGHGEVTFGARDVDVIFHPKLRDDLYFALVSEPLGGESGPHWVDAYGGGIGYLDLLSSVGICTEPVTGSGGGTTTLDGGDGWFESCHSPAGGHAVAVATATRGYIIYLHVEDDPRLQRTYDGAWFEAALETVDLRPEDAPDALNPSESP